VWHVLISHPASLLERRGGGSKKTLATVVARVLM
jgi:hypothetical protein